MLYKLFSSFKIDGAVNFSSRQVTRRVGYFSHTKNTRPLNFYDHKNSIYEMYLKVQTRLFFKNPLAALKSQSHS